MHTRLTIFLLALVLCVPCVAWGKSEPIPKAAKAYFLWGDNAICQIEVLPDFSMGGYSGQELARLFARFMQNRLRERGFSVAEVADISDGTEFWEKHNKNEVSPRLFVVLYGDEQAYIRGLFLRKDSPEQEKATGRYLPLLPYIQMRMAKSYAGDEAFLRDLEGKAAAPFNERMDRTFAAFRNNGALAAANMGGECAIGRLATSLSCCFPS